MDLLLDTHAFLWWSLADSRTRASWVEHIADPANTVYLSAATAWEVSIKRRAGKLRFEQSTVEAASFHSFTWLPITPGDAEAAGSLDWDHRDPFDRMLVAQAIGHDLVIVTADDTVRNAPGVRVL